MLTADQRDSSRSEDAVPEALEALAAIDGFTLAWERTAGDEIQALTTSPSAAVQAVSVLVRLGTWRVGLGVGSVQLPLPDSTRAARGTAYVRARDAVDRARRSPVPVAIEGTTASDAEDALWLLVTVLDRRTPEGWRVADLLDEGRTQYEVAAILAISQSAVSQRAARAAVEQVRRGAALVERELQTALGKMSVGLDRLAP